jgi:hypothetical protein
MAVMSDVANARLMRSAMLRRLDWGSIGGRTDFSDTAFVGGGGFRVVEDLRRRGSRCGGRRSDTRLKHDVVVRL